MLTPIRYFDNQLINSLPRIHLKKSVDSPMEPVRLDGKLNFRTSSHRFQLKNLTAVWSLRVFDIHILSFTLKSSSLSLRL